MAKTAVLTASGVIKANSGELYTINVTKVATGAGVVRVWDSPSTTSGTKLFEGDGLAQGSFNLGDPANTGAIATQGLYLELGGTTNATVVVVYD